MEITCFFPQRWGHLRGSSAWPPLQEPGQAGQCVVPEALSGVPRTVPGTVVLGVPFYVIPVDTASVVYRSFLEAGCRGR